MPQTTPDDKADRRVSDAQERARALAEVLRHQEERAKAAQVAEERRVRRTRVRRGVVTGAWAVAAYVWILSPSWTRVAPPPPPPVAEDGRAVEVNLFLQAQQIRAFQEARGRLPWVLQETGPPLPGMEYRRLDNQHYELEARSRRVRLAWSSEEGVEGLLEDVPAYLLREPDPALPDEAGPETASRPTATPALAAPPRINSLGPRR